MRHFSFQFLWRAVAGFLAVATLLLAIQPAHALEKASLQLKWLHHFQFAGYYVALEKGYYRQAGLDVTILEGGPNNVVENEVAAGRVEFGVGTSALIINMAQGRDFVVLGQIFQHSPAIFLTPRKTGIRSVRDMAGQRFMHFAQHGDMQALLKKNGIEPEQIVEVPQQGDPRDLIEGKADVMLAYSFNEPYIMELAGEPYFTFSPLSFGIDFYGDNFFTSRKLVNDRPEYVAAFRAATLRGWHYAMENKAETVDLILAKYSTRLSREHLLFEADSLDTLIQPNLVELGYQSLSRWQRISETYSDLGMIPKGFDPSPIMYIPGQINDYRPLITVILIATTIIAALVLLVLTFRSLNRKLKKQIEERKHAEEERLNMERQLLHAQKMESLGVLAGGIAHDFNNILTAIIGNIELAQMRIDKDSPAVDNLQKVEHSAIRAADLARQMLAYSGKGKFLIENLDLNRLIVDVTGLLEVSIFKKCQLRLNLASSLPYTEVDATQIRQVILNLVINASEAIADASGVITITTTCLQCDMNCLKDSWLYENLSEGLYVCLDISDTGCGMDRETLDKIFDPFFTTKFTGRGLGMSAVLGIIRSHNGAIKVESEPGAGTRFKVLFPASNRPVEMVNIEDSRDDWHGRGTALLVDDEEVVREIGSEMLKELGFTVITAVDGVDALDLYRTTPDISFVILDLTMPNMDGGECFAALKKINQKVKVIMSSGYSEEETTQCINGKELAGFIQKPYKLSALKEVIRGVV